MKRLIFLTGFAGTGKTTVGRLVAERLHWDFLDTDEMVVLRAGKSIPTIFRGEGEEAFRALERAVLADAAGSDDTVVSCGGGAVVDPANRELMQQGLVVCLEARPETVLARLRPAMEALSDEERPLLAGPDPLERIRSLKAERQPVYAAADWTVHTDSLSPEDAANEVVRAWAQLGAPAIWASEADVAAVVRSEMGPYPVLVGWGLLSGLGDRLRQVGLARSAWLVTYEHVGGLYAKQALASIRAAGLEGDALVLPPGEPTKSFESLSRIYAWLAAHHAERGDAVIALGGGVVGDLAGTVAATYVRGMPFVQVPTSLLAMVDASIGGKVAVNLPEGKNLVGAFFPPRLVLADVATLATLPPRACTEGWAEVVKHGFILDLDYLDTLEEQADLLKALAPEPTVAAIARSVAIKAAVVSRDEHETSGLRSLLNYGHTLGHALEAVTGYQTLLHGEAVAIGMVGAARISHRMGLLSSDDLARHDAIIARFGLPTRCPPVAMPALHAAMRLDKKVQGGSQRWVLLERLGLATLHDEVPAEAVDSVIAELMRAV